MKQNKRQLETFELNAEYYAESFINGNKNHVAEELSELMLTSFSAFQNIVLQLPKEVQKFVLNSKFYFDSNLKLTIAIEKMNLNIKPVLTNTPTN